MVFSNSFNGCAEKGGFSEKVTSIPTHTNSQRVGTQLRNRSPIPAALKLGQPVRLPQDQAQCLFAHLHFRKT